ncbi:uncharacterized protein LOC126377253 [Pectinophora gossypiella]|uniref:uncharacterized protein LOC126377253 n=1 Tax=Pectinophora gossypiella TaxID=13191 RepID=UPI00214E6A73|nr:uncharacterized protein LOC126377253 [Pectinophora gossypiella]
MKAEEELAIKGAHLLGPSLESKFDELKYEITHKIDKELTDSQNAREYICQKYDELCSKIQYLSELDATVTGFRSDVRAVEKQVTALAGRVDHIEKRALYRDCPSLTSSNF